MASLLDVGLLGFFLPFFVFLFIFVVLFGFLEKSGVFGEKSRKINIVAALSVAAISIFSGDLVKIIQIVTPWIAFTFIMLVLLFSLYMFFGEKPERVWDIIGYTPVALLIIGIILLGIVNVFEAEVSPFAEGEEIEVVGDDGTVTVQKAKNPTNEALKTNQEITISYLKREEVESQPNLARLAKGLPEGIKNLRIVKIGNIDEQADGGPHVKNTSEIPDLIFLKAENKGKNNRRVHFELKT